MQHLSADLIAALADLLFADLERPPVAEVQPDDAGELEQPRHAAGGAR